MNIHEAIAIVSNTTTANYSVPELLRASRVLVTALLNGVTEQRSSDDITSLRRRIDNIAEIAFHGCDQQGLNNVVTKVAELTSRANALEDRIATTENLIHTRQNAFLEYVNRQRSQFDRLSSAINRLTAAQQTPVSQTASSASPPRRPAAKSASKKNSTDSGNGSSQSSRRKATKQRQLKRPTRHSNRSDK